jgi:ADP-L-glycero-D-manno-heptose 6-epimerase
MHTQADIVLSRKNLNFDPMFSLEEGIKQYIPVIQKFHGEPIN